MAEKNRHAETAAEEEILKQNSQEAAEETAGEAEAEAAAETQEEAAEAAETDAEAAQERPEEKDKPAKDPKDKTIDELTDKYKRLFAEFDNYRKRTDAEKASSFSEGERAVLLKILPLIDNFDRALDNVPEDLKGNAYVDGMDKVYQSFIALLKELGVEAIEAKGQPFDANLHNAVMHVEDPEQPENTVAEEFQKGYLFRGKVLRYSMVKVAN